MALFGMYSVRLGEVQNGLDNRTKTNSDWNSRLSGAQIHGHKRAKRPQTPFYKSTKAAPKQQPLGKWHASSERGKRRKRKVDYANMAQPPQRKRRKEISWHQWVTTSQVSALQNATDTHLTIPCEMHDWWQMQCYMQITHLLPPPPVPHVRAVVSLWGIPNSIHCNRASRSK